MPVVSLARLLITATLVLQAAADWRTVPLDSYPPDARLQIAAAREAVVARPTDAAAVGELALVLHAWEQYELAAQAYAEAQRLAPGEVTWWALSGVLATRMGRHDTAVIAYEHAAALSPTPLLLLRHADALLEQAQLERARAAYERAVQRPEAEPAARYGLGRIAVASGDPTRARAEFERAVALVPTFGAAHYALALLQRKAGDMDAARASIARQQQCLACWPMPADPYAARLASVRSDASALLQRGIDEASRADAAAAIALHEDAVAKNPGLLQARVNLITLYGRTGNLPKAEAHYQAVVASGTQLAEAHHAFGLALLALKEPARAQAILRLAIEANPQDAEAHNGLGLIAETTGQGAEAEAAYRAAAAAMPRQRGFHFNLARALVSRGRLDEAVAELMPLATPDDAESVRYVYAASAILARKGDAPAARRLGEEALARARRHGQAEMAAAIERDLQRLK